MFKTRDMYGTKTIAKPIYIIQGVPKKILILKPRPVQIIICITLKVNKS